jgi:hypothetical protein
MQIALTALVTILVGALTLIVGQIIVRGALEPALELKRLIGTIAHDLDFYANRFVLPLEDEQWEEKQREWRDLFRKHACSLREAVTVIIWYQACARVLQLPPEEAVRTASQYLMSYSNRSSEPSGERPPEAEIKTLLRITPPKPVAVQVAPSDRR